MLRRAVASSSRSAVGSLLLAASPAPRVAYQLRPLSSSAIAHAEDAGQQPGPSPSAQSPSASTPAFDDLSQSSMPGLAQAQRSRSLPPFGGGAGGQLGMDTAANEPPIRSGRSPYHFHVKSSRNNTIITMTDPFGAVLYSSSGGKVGFKGSNRSGYEAGYRTALDVFTVISERRYEWQNPSAGKSKKRRKSKPSAAAAAAGAEGQAANAQGQQEQEVSRGLDLPTRPPLTSVEVVWNGFGEGREAVLKALSSSEGTEVRNMVTSMTDATRIKIGGARPKKQRNY